MEPALCIKRIGAKNVAKVTNELGQSEIIGNLLTEANSNNS